VTTGTGGTAPVEASQVVTDYFNALQYKMPAAARALLAPTLLATTSESDLVTAVRAVNTITVTAMDTISNTSNRVIFKVTLNVTPNTSNPSNWNSGTNTRWVSVIRVPEGWRIEQIATSSLP